MKSERMVIAAIILSAICSEASASPVAIGDPYDGGSWYQSWQNGNISGGFDMVAVKIFSPGDIFELPAVSNLSSGWSVDFSSTNLVIFSRDDGANVGSVNFGLHHNGSKAVEGALLDTVWASFRDGILVENADVTRGISGQTYDWGGGWRGDFNTSWSDPQSEVQAIIAVPAPGAALLALLGMPMVGWVKRRLG